MLLTQSPPNQLPRRLFVSGFLSTLSILWGVWAAIVCSNASVEPLAQLSLLGTGLMLFVSWVACQMALSIWPIPSGYRRFRRVSGVPPLMFFLAVGLGLTEFDLSARVWLSRGPLELAAQSALSGETGSSVPGWIGFFPVSHIERIEHSVRFTTAERFFGSAGLTYSPEAPPPRVDKDDQRHLWGPWWVWRS